jgi:hypothetical protein
MDGQGSAHWSAYTSAYQDLADLCLWGGSERSEYLTFGIEYEDSHSWVKDGETIASESLLNGLKFKWLNVMPATSRSDGNVVRQIRTCRIPLVFLVHAHR